jgi:hypothetical protein
MPKRYIQASVLEVRLYLTSPLSKFCGGNDVFGYYKGCDHHALKIDGENDHCLFGANPRFETSQHA